MFSVPYELDFKYYVEEIQDTKYVLHNVCNQPGRYVYRLGKLFLYLRASRRVL